VSSHNNPFTSRKSSLDRRAIDTVGYLLVAAIWLERQIGGTSKPLTGLMANPALSKAMGRRSRGGLR
jgi:hypothetical protein